MPEPKTIEVDEILPAPSSGKDSKHIHSHRGQSHHSKENQTTNPEPTANNPFPDIASALGWKARLTLKLTQSFLYLRRKRWGKWVMGPLVIFTILLAIPLAIIALFGLFLISILRAFFPPKRKGEY